MGQSTTKQTRRHELSPGKRWLFRIIVLSLPLLFFLLLEAFLQLVQYGGNLSLFVPLKGEYARYKTVNPLVGRRFFFNQSTVPTPNNDVFLKEKPANGLRIFVLGGSTTAGYPFSPNIMFSRILYFLLKKAYPDRHVEVINTAMAAINTYALVDFLEEIMAEQPDAILIYAGHNEFYGALGVASYESLGRNPAVIIAYLKLKKFRTFLLIRDGVVWLKHRLATLMGKEIPADPSATLMERIVANQQIPYHSPLYYAGLQQFKRNMQFILRKCQQHGIPVVVSELVANIRDLPPFVSVTSDSFPEAAAIYQHARTLEHQERWQEAQQAYYHAKDLDALRFRATEELNAQIHKLALHYKIPVVPMKAYFEKASYHGLIGDSLMVDHLHPNIRGYFLMAQAFYETLMKANVLGRATAHYKLKPFLHQLRRISYTALDSVYGDIRVRVLKGGWPFQKHKGPNKALLNFKPANPYEALAFKAWATNKLTIEKAHVQLAEQFEKQKQWKKALAEYQALLHLTPYNVSPYLNIARLYIEHQELKAALPYLLESLKLESTAYAQKWVGQILLQMGQKQRALPYLQRAVREKPQDVQLLYNLSGAYALNGNYEKAYQTLLKAEAIDPDFPDLKSFKQQLEKVLNKTHAD